MHDATNDDAARSFAERLRDAVQHSDGADTRARRRHKHRRVVTPLSSPLANPTRARYSDELFVDRIRKALD